MVTNKLFKISGALHRLKYIYPQQSAMPEVRGTADIEWWNLFPFRSILLVLTHDFIIIHVYGPTGSDGHEWVKRR